MGVLEQRGVTRLDGVIRALAAAGKALRLYPPTSPLPRQSVVSAEEALASYFSDGETVLSLAVGREGFMLHGEPVGASAAGSTDLVEALRSHAVAELAMTPSPSADELLCFLQNVLAPPDAVKAGGGLSAMLAAAGVETIRAVDVRLTVVERIGPAPDEDVDEFLRTLARSPEALSTWFAAASDGDPATFEEGLMELARVSGPGGLERLAENLAHAFTEQTPASRDVLLGLAMEQGPTRELAGGMFRHLTSGDIAGSVLGGAFGKNMLSLSSALTHLPLDRVTAQVRAEVQAMLPAAGHTAKEAAFLEHMIETRSRTTPEPALIDADTTYRSVAQALSLNAETVTRARDAVGASRRALSAASVRTMLSLLDQQQDFELYCSGADNLAGLVPRLIEQGDLHLAATVVTELSTRESLNTSPWPQLAVRLADSLAVAAGTRSMSALVKAVIADETLVPVAREIVKRAGDAGTSALIGEAIALKGPGIEIAEALAGRRVVDLLNQRAAGAQWFQVAPIVTRLAREGDPRSVATIETLLRRPDVQSRREAVTGLAIAGGPVAERLLGGALRDASAEVQIVAARALARLCSPSAAILIAARIGELDIDNADFPVARELIMALGKVPGRPADEALAKLAGRRTLIKRGRFAEVQEAVRQSLALRTSGGGGGT